MQDCFRNCSIHCETTMRVETQQVEVRGHSLHRIIMHPEPSTPVCAVAIFYHGQGGYAERYPEVLEVFTKRGIRCVITDLPGHGRSPGRRGHVGDERVLDSVIQSSLKEVGNLPHGVMGHSMGGLLALRHLVLAGKGLLPKPAFSWISSPLIDPGGGRPPWFRKMVSILAPVFPWFTVSTGVTSAMCRVVDGQQEETPSKKSGLELWHRRVSLGWGVFLIQTAEWLQQTASHVAKDLPLLMTQGGDDPVCPPRNAREFFDKLGSDSQTYLEIEGVLHEPFSGLGKEPLFEALENWLSELQLDSQA